MEFLLYAVHWNRGLWKTQVHVQGASRGIYLLAGGMTSEKGLQMLWGRSEVFSRKVWPACSGSVVWTGPLGAGSP